MINYSFSMYEFEYFLLILARVASFVFVAPFFSTNNTPRRVRAAFSFFFAVLIYEATMPHQAMEYRTVLEYAMIVTREVFTGLLIGLGVNICTYIVSFAGRMVDMEIGLAMASEYDPMTKDTVSVSGIFYQYMVLLLLIVSNLHQYLVKAFVETYTLIPVNGAVFHSASRFLCYADHQCHSGYYGKGCSAAQHVCCWYADQTAVGAWSYVFDGGDVTVYIGYDIY